MPASLGLTSRLPLGRRFGNRIRQWFGRWLFQLAESEPGEVFLNQRRVFILPTRPGLALGVTLLLLFIGSINYSLSLGFGLTFLIGACAVIDMHMTFRNLAHLHLSPGRTQPVFAGEEAQFELHLANRRKHDRYALRIGFLTESPSLEQTTDIRGQSTATVTLSAPTAERGWMRAPRIRLQTRFPLGLLRAWSYWRPEMAVLVYPQPESGGPPLPMQDVASGEGNGNVGHDDFAGIRGYQPGDSIKHLAWRQIARLDPASAASLVTKQFEGGGKRQLAIDFSRLPRTMDVEARLSRMARWVVDADALGLPYAFQLGATSFEPAHGPAHRHACLQALALYEGA